MVQFHIRNNEQGYPHITTTQSTAGKQDSVLLALDSDTPQAESAKGETHLDLHS